MSNTLMKKTLVTLMSVVTLGSIVSPLASAQEGELKNELKQTYLADPTSLDYTFSMRDLNSWHTVNFVDGLYENDQYGNYIPALAESHEVSEDGLTYTYKIRKGVKWVDMNGNEVAETTAHDFVTGLQHAADVQSEILPVVQDSIKGLNEYVKGEIEFDQVGVKALDDYTLQYTLTRPEPYFNSKTSYSVLYPINKEFLESKGEEFGSLSPDSILYNGPFLLQSVTAKSSIEYIKNENYWDKDNVFIDKISFMYNDGQDVESYFRLFKDNANDSFLVYPTLPMYDQVKKEYPDGITVQQPAGSTFLLQFNLNRTAQNQSGKTDPKEFESTQKAIHNKKFRQAIMFAFDRASYMAQSHGDEFKNEPLRNILVPPTFVKVDGASFGEAVAKELEAINPELYAGIDLSDGQDPWFNPEKAKKVFEEARKELEAEGVTFPIKLDLPVLETVPRQVNFAKSLKQNLETVLGSENIVVDPILLAQDPYYAATFNATVAEEVDYDFTNESGWIPDYLDPSTFLDIYGPKNGSFIIPIGFNPIVEGEDDPTIEIREKMGMMEYQKLLDEAATITDDINARYKAYAKAQAYLTDMAIALPIRNGASNVRVTRIVPFSGPYAFAGNGDRRYKFTKVQKDPVTKEQFEKALAEWKSKAADFSESSTGEAKDEAATSGEEAAASEETPAEPASDEASSEEVSQ